MDPFSISVGALQCAQVAAQVTVTIIKWVGDVKTVDQRIRGFYEEVLALRATYEGLEESLRSPMMAEAARVASQNTDGAILWQQVRIALDDSTKTIGRIQSVLDDISRHTGPLRRVKTQLQESLTNGELGRLRQRVQFFNATISLPIQMVCVMLQLEQRGMTAEHQRKLDLKFMSIESTMRNLIRELTQPSRSSTTLSGASTLIVGGADGNLDPRGKDSYLTFAKKIISSASAAASTRSSLSTISPQIDPPTLNEVGASPPPYAAQHQQDQRRTSQWTRTLSQTTTNPVAELSSPIDLPPAVPPESPMPRGPSSEVAYKLTRTHLKLGQEKADQGNHENAEKSFRKALDLLENNDFSGRIAFTPAEVVLMLSNSCFHQKKYNDAIELLTPVAEREVDVFPKSARTAGSISQPSTTSVQPDTLQALAASHMLGQVYQQQGDLEKAKEHTLKAFLARMDELGDQDSKTLESVQLLVNIFRDMGDEADAEAYAAFLEPEPVQKSDAYSQLSRTAAATEDETAVASGSPPPSEIAFVPPPLAISHPTQQPRSSFASRFRNIGRNSNTNLQRSPNAEPQRNSFSRTPTLDEGYNTSILSPTTRADTRHFSASESSYDRPNSFVDDLSTAPSSAKPTLERSASIRTLEPTFQAVQQLCIERKHAKAVDLAISFMEAYESNTFILRRDALEKNIKKGGDKGLAATGHGYAPIHFFCELKEECVGEVALLLKYGADPNAIAYKAGYTASNSPDILSPLHLAISRGHNAIAALLLEHKDLKPDIKDGIGFYPLLAACRTRNYAVVRTLLTNFAPKCIPRDYPSSWYGNSVLHDAARHCDLRLVDLLLETGLFDVNQCDKFGKVCLHHAVIKTDVARPEQKAMMLAERQAVVQRLLDAGAEKNAIDNREMTPRAYADREQVSEGANELIALLGEVRFEMA